MHLKSRRQQLAMMWMLSMVVLGFAAGVTSLIGWTVLLALALTPPLVVVSFWHEPAQVLSGTIPQARR